MESHGQLPGRRWGFWPELRPRRGNRRGRRHPARLIAVAAVVTLAAAACGSSGSGSSVKNGGVFRLGSNSSIDSLNPFVAFQGDAYVTFEYIYPMLVQYNPKLQFVADFARTWIGEPRREGLDLPHPAGRQVVRRQAADRGRRGLDLQHDPEVSGRPHRQLGRLRRAHEERDRP